MRTIEVAWLQKFRSVQTVLTAYYSRIEDQIQRIPAGEEDGRETPIDGESQDLSGMEVEIHAELSDNWFLRATAAQFELPEDPRSASRNPASLILNYRLGDWNTNLNGFCQSSVQTRTDPQELEGYWLINLNVRRDVGQPTLSGSVDNLFDEDYATFTTTKIPGGTPGRGRAFRVGLEYRF